MKALLLIPTQYSLLDTIADGFAANNVETVRVDYETFFKPSVNSFVKKYESLPNKIKNTWKGSYLKKINNGYLRLFETHNPGIVFIYNNQHILPETVKYFRTKSKVVFFLGDNPLYTPTNDTNLAILFHADYIMCPDTFWVNQLHKMGLDNAYFGVFGFNENIFYPFKPSNEDYEKYKCDLAYVGTAQKTNWGFKRFLFLNSFIKLDMKAYISGSGYSNKWKKYFPELDEKIIPYESFNPKFNNLLSNCGKIYPVDLVPSLFNGIHIRIMDCIGSGIMPMVEYSSDLDLVFNDTPIPFIKNYHEAESTARIYLNNDSKREAVINNLRDFVKVKYAPKKIVGGILEKLNL
jgi:DUF based on E. rectale Gene description (DUF3880)